MRFVLLSLFLLPAVVSFSQKQKPQNKFSDDVIIKIADFQDRRLSDSLFQFLEHKNSSYRKEAVLAFGSIQDTTAVSAIARLLKDVDASVRQAAAFALGQAGTSSASISLLQRLPNEADVSVRNEILEAIGKTISKEQLPEFLKVELGASEGLSWCFYRLGLRGLADSTVIKKAIPLLDKNLNEHARLGAAHFFSRGPIKIESAQSALIEASLRDPSAEVRMAATFSLRRIRTDQSLQTLIRILEAELDYRVRANAARALQVFSPADVFAPLKKSLNDANPQVQIAASEVIKSIATIENFSALVQAARNTTNWRVQGNLFEATLRVSNHKETVEEVFTLYKATKNPYAKAGLLNALGQAPMAYSFIQTELMQSSVPVIKLAATEALVSMNRHPQFDKSFQKRFADIYMQAMKKNDPAVIGTIASALADSTLGYKKIFADYSFLYDARKALSLPRDNEALQPLEAAIAYFEGKTAPPIVNEFNHPINWRLVKSIHKNQQVIIKTTKGNITLRLFVEEAPGSVANFVQLINDGYFNQKNFHRVVPNFVIQGGCNRGDGWGSEDYSIRSEFSLRRYTTGSVGMASAGKDTEGTQWFITHSPTPHLDGRYTIFAEVVDGMKVVHQIEVGDLILKIELIDSN